MDDLQFFDLAARVARRIGKTATAADIAEAHALAHEATLRSRRAAAAGRPALLFKLVGLGLPEFTAHGHLKTMPATFDVGLLGGTVQRFTTRLPGALLAWLAVASGDGAEIDLLGDQGSSRANAARNAVRGTFLPHVARLCPILGDVLAAHLKVVRERVVFEPDAQTPSIITH